MDDLNEGLGKRIGGLGGCALPALTLVLAALLVVVAAGIVVGADGDASIETLKGKTYRMADAVMADQLTRYGDPTGDQSLSDGTPATDAPAWSDMAAVYVAATRTPAKLRTKMKSDHPPGASDAFYGSMARPKAKERIVFVAVKMAAALPAGARGQLVEIGLAGADATPVQVGTGTDTLAGIETFSLSGLFRNGSVATGDTDITGKEPGVELEDADFYNAESGVYGFYDPKKATWYVVVPRAGDTDAITVSVHSTTRAGQVTDRLDLPGGGHFIDLRAPTGGFKAKGDLSPLSCRALETFSGEGGIVELSDVDATLIRYTAGVDASVGEKKTAELLGSAIEAVGPVSVALTAVGAEAEPLIVDGELSASPDARTISLTFEAPAGQWRFALADELELKTPAGERIIDHTSLTGTAGILTGPGLDGFVAGNPACFASVAADPSDPADGADAADGADETASPEVVEPEA